jgi:hypothetical protein
LRQLTLRADDEEKVLMDLKGSPGFERDCCGTSRAAATQLVRAGLFLCLAFSFAYAQNAAQRAALAKLKSATTNGGSSSSVEGTDISLNRPGGLAFDSSGNLYIADADDNLIREVNPQGVIITVAGTGEQGFFGDNGPATSAILDSPEAVAVDANGNIYIADTHNNRIREVSNGTITTIAGTGASVFSGDGGAATSAQLNYPTAIAVDTKGNLYIADTNNFRIREISGTTISTVAGDGEQTYSGDGGPATAAGLDSPNGIAVDSSFNLYIGDTHNQRVRMVTHATGNISTLAGTGAKTFTADGAATAAALARPRGVAVDSSGNVYLADSDNDRIRMISNGAISTIAGNGTEGFSGDGSSSTSASLDTPRAVAASGSSIAFADTNNDQVRMVVNNAVNTVAGFVTNGMESLIITGPASAIYGTGSLTATFSNNGQTATGTVTFFDGEGPSPAMVGTDILSSNTAVFNASQLSAGTHYLIASYAGDANNPAIVSGVFVYTVFSTDFTVAASPSAQSVLPSQSAQYTITLAPTNATFLNPVTLSVSGLPQGVTASLNPTSIAAGAGATKVTLTLTTAGQARTNDGPHPWSRGAGPVAISFLLMPLLFGRRLRTAGRKLSDTTRMLLVILALGLIGACSGCGSGGFFDHADNTYTVTVTAVSGPDTHTTTVSLTVQ